jgi:mono/diheme cytochrome c family protein
VSRRIWGWVGAALLGSGCVSAIPVPTTQDAEIASQRFGPTAIKDLEAGRKAYISSCAGCHNLYVPSHLSAEKWPAVVADMSKRGKVPEATQARIERYLVTMASRPKE